MARSPAAHEEPGRETHLCSVLQHQSLRHPDRYMQNRKTFNFFSSIYLFKNSTLKKRKSQSDVYIWTDRNVGGWRETEGRYTAEICCMLTLFWSYRAELSLAWDTSLLPLIIARCGRKWCRQLGCAPHGAFFPLLPPSKKEVTFSCSKCSCELSGKRNLRYLPDLQTKMPPSRWYSNTVMVSDGTTLSTRMHSQK